MQRTWRTARWALLGLVMVACGGDSDDKRTDAGSVPLDAAATHQDAASPAPDGGKDAPSTTPSGDGAAGASGGSDAHASASDGPSSASSDAGAGPGGLQTCAECPGPRPGAANFVCPDGVSVAGPACVRNAQNVCGWSFLSCPAPTDGGVKGDGGFCVENVLCVQGAHWDHERCRCVR